ncbi:hypothetical protein RAA17_12935 [Komagataeibacter rhaeticus]|nr:hypothetical protein [Komagataeibacter rhaeticus]
MTDMTAVAAGRTGVARWAAVAAAGNAGTCRGRMAAMPEPAPAHGMIALPCPANDRGEEDHGPESRGGSLFQSGHPDRGKPGPRKRCGRSADPLAQKGDEHARAALDSLRQAAASMQAERTRAQYLWDLAAGRNPAPPADTTASPDQQNRAARPHTFLDSLLDDLTGTLL